MKLFRIVIALAILSGAVISISTATPAYTKKEGKKCTCCHTTAGQPALNSTGQCYQTNNHSLATCAAPPGN